MPQNLRIESSRDFNGFLEFSAKTSGKNFELLIYFSLQYLSTILFEILFDSCLAFKNTNSH